MSCRRYREDIGLLAGHDLDDASRAEAARRHMAECPDCRDRFGRAKAGVSVLAAAAVAPAASGSTWSATAESCWPAVQQRMSGRGGGGSPAAGDRFRGWAPATAMAAACLVMLTVFLLDGVNPGGGTTAEAVPVAAPPEPAPTHDSRVYSPTRTVPAGQGGFRVDAETGRTLSF